VNYFWAIFCGHWAICFTKKHLVLETGLIFDLLAPLDTTAKQSGIAVLCAQASRCSSSVIRNAFKRPKSHFYVYKSTYYKNT
jgi:hypothetical protein